jgi:hypothetical protein
VRSIAALRKREAAGGIMRAREVGVGLLIRVRETSGLEVAAGQRELGR